MTVSIRNVTAANQNDLARRFEARGGPQSCWCMAWRAKPKEDRTLPSKTRAAIRKGQLLGRVARGERIGLLAYVGTDPVGWCSVGPVSGFRRLGLGDVGDPDAAWAISCFFVPRAQRGQGISTVLARAAIETARKAGAVALIATPVDAEAPAYRFMGLVPQFERLGFREVATAGHQRRVMRLEF